ncbi:MAG: hypothetical protein A2015_12835 [Spirochaetes bacterium GWF1_31_7]|nr:MAG: hypothetical protein A2Y30_10625 [Spirochaetes bacterium GWE1_32_154]OHD49267.1 MAG: hypothetical protein A2Y29_16255 [Spirochaetes bacterium GWE2_31_10]OHD51829.1 MAG: hypothetical protein A2015_12835 [Spirochaetes bacterium GWF1_31_7]OHD73276.1 MAG: hypothetical protein A2355_04200 [Spirochaetes bacterium RIFOXYB1_FULL_32_8]HBD95312.1 MerR family transcriptional regulator [Spirochaetia bacterium]
MFQIGTFSKLCKVTVKALRYYEELDILKPELINPESGYRMYSTLQLAKVSEIVRLKEMGFSLDEIHFILKNSLPPEKLADLLEKKRKYIQQDIIKEEMKIVRITDYIHKIKEEAFMSECFIKELPEVIVASMRKVISKYDDLFEIVPPMGKIMEKHGAICREPAYCFNIYHDEEYKEENIDVEVCEAVTKKLENKDGVIYKKIEGVSTAACIYHKGPYNLLGNSYSILLSWVEKSGYTIAGQPRESYIDGCWNKESETEWLTEIQIPVRVK